MNELKMGADPSDFLDNLNALHYIINGIVNKVNTTELVKVVAVYPEKNKIDVIPIVKNANAENNPIEESVVYGVRYIEWQYGLNGIMAVPEIGDIGLIVVCKKDISEVEKGLVASFRKYCLADGIYLGGIKGLNQTPTQFIKFDNNGITITSPSSITINSENTSVNTTNVNIVASGIATITSPVINLGGEGGAAVARVGDSVVNGKITTGSSIVKAV